MAGRVARMKLASKLVGINTWRNARARGKTVGAVTSGRFKGSEGSIFQEGRQKQMERCNTNIHRHEKADALFRDTSILSYTAVVSE